MKTMNPTTFKASLMAIVASALCALPVHAATYDWNVNSGDWDTTTSNWTGAGTEWVNGNDAVFNNSVGTTRTITLNGTISATSLLFGNATASGNFGDYILTGGTLTNNGTLVVQGLGSNGAVYTSNPTVSINSDVTVTGSTLIGRANLAITGGNYTTDRFTTNPASNDWGRLVISGGNVTATNGIDGTYGTNGSNGSTATFQVELNGGTLFTPSLKVADREISSQNAVLNFNGTVVKATASTATFITLYGGNQNAYVGSGGAILDTNGNDITIGVNLKDSSSTVSLPNQVGTLTKQGNGTLTLSGNNTYTGTTTVSAGTLLINGSTSTSSAVTVASGATLGGNGTVGGFTTVNGNLNPGNSPGVLTFSSGLTLNGTATMEINSDGTPGTDYDQVVVSSGTTTFGGALVFTFGPSALLDNDEIALFNFVGTSQGNFSSVTSTGFYSGTWSVGVANDTWTFNNGTQLLTFSEVTGNLNVIPEPSTWALLAFSLTTVMVLRRRRS